ncbi:MAG: type IX secretion system outer membrane channel protein PorV [Tannerella sp.]|jgi:hypothetical protein|nr:type IX secretion system outer membrane channel protein PorV [Tannerella sp.]
MRLFKFELLILLCFISSAALRAQGADDDDKNQFSPLNTAVPSLSIAPDARGGGMGDNGAATLPDISSQYWNPSKYAFMESKAGVGLSYTPWMRKIVRDVAMAYLSGYYKLGQYDQHAIGASLRYFTLGEVPLTDIGGNTYQNLNPYEMALDASYSIKLSEGFSLGVAMRYIRSDMGANAEDELRPGNSVAADLSGYGERYIILGSNECLWSGGFNISNMGNKVSYDGGTTNQFLPTNLRIGTGMLMPLDEYNQLGIYLDLNKYLVPSKPVRMDNETEDDYQTRSDEYNDMKFMKGIFKSFSDAPGGFSEELKEINISIAAEYNYNSQFFVRAGYFYENRMKGNRQYFSAGAGFKMNVFQLDAAYLISTVQSNPLDQTLRFTLSFDMDGLKGLFD